MTAAGDDVAWSAIEERVVAAVHQAYRAKHIAPEQGIWNLRGGSLEALHGCRGFCVQGAILLREALPALPLPAGLGSVGTIYDRGTAYLLNVPVGYAMGLRVGFDIGSSAHLPEVAEGYLHGVATGRRLAEELQPQHQPCQCGCRF